MEHPERAIVGFHSIVVATVIAIAVLTATAPGFQNLLRDITQESGVFEIGGFFGLMSAGGYCGLLWGRFRCVGTPFWLRRTILGIGCIALLAGLEEISWGQHLLGFNPAAFFLRHNRQGEANLHNLIPAPLFGFLTNAAVYSFFIFLPLFIHSRQTDDQPGDISRTSPISPISLTPSFVNVQLFCFAFTLQAYFIQETLTDTLALLAALIWSGWLILKNTDLRTPPSFGLWGANLLCTAIFMATHRIFNYKNMQYEIREFVIVYAFLYWLIDRLGRTSARELSKRPSVRTTDATIGV